MTLVPDVVFVGQGPNRACWERGIDLGRSLRPDDPEGFAAEYARRLSLTGRAGKLIAGLCGMEPREFCASYARRNLNRAFLGKQGRGDRFDAIEAVQRAREINSSGFRRFVLLGRHVADAFGFRFEPLRVHAFVSMPRSYLLFPHPSGANAFWNAAASRRAARAVLRAFLELDEPRGVERFEETTETVAIRAVQEQACRVFRVEMADLLSASSKQPLASYRVAAMAMAREVSGASYPAIAHAFGRNHHGSAIRALDATIARSETDGDFREVFHRFRDACREIVSVPTTAE